MIGGYRSSNSDAASTPTSLGELPFDYKGLSGVVLDEPTAGLDAPTRARVWELIERAAHTAIVLVSTHDEDAPARQDDTVIEL